MQIESGQGQPKQSAMLLVLFGGVLLGALDIAIVGPALPALERAFAVDARRLAWVFNTYILFGLIGAQLLAAWSDRLGRRRVFMACLLTFGLGSSLVALAPTFEALLVGRAIQAFGAGGTLPIASAFIADNFPLERRGRALGLIGAVFGIAFVIGPVLGGILLRWSWRWLFLVNLPLVVVLVPASFRVLPATVERHRKVLDWRGALALSVTLAAAAWGVSRLEAGELLAGALSPGCWIFFALALAGGGVFWVIEHRSAEPILAPALLASAQMRLVGAIAFATGLVEASMVFLPILAVTAFAVSESAASFMLLPLVVALIAGSVVAGRMLDRTGAKPVVLTGLLLIVTGLVLFAELSLVPATFYIAGVCVGLGLSSLLGAPLRFLALQEGGEARRGMSQGFLTLCLSSGRMLGAALIGGIAASDTSVIAGYRNAMLYLAIACAAAAVSSLGLRSGATGTQAANVK